MLHAVQNPNSQQNKMPAIISSEDGFLGHQRMRELELRVNQAEQSNRALLEELVRLQNEYKLFTRRTDKLLEEERQATRHVEQANQVMQQKLIELEERNRRAEHDVNETKNALSQLVNHTRGVERAVTSSQQDLINKKEQSLLRVTELNHLCTELKRQLEHEARARVVAEQAFSSRISDLTNLIAEQDRKREEMLRIIETRQRDFTSSTDADRYKIQHKIDQTIGVVTSEVTTREARLKQELQEKFYNLERQIATDRENKLHDRSLRDELERRIHSSKKRFQDDVTAIRNKLEADNKDVDVKIRELYKATNLLDQEVQQVREHSVHILGAESKARKKSEKEIYKRLEECEDRLKTGLATVTDTVSSIRTDSNSRVTEVKIADLKIHQISQDKADKVKMDIENNLRELDNKINQVEEQLLEYEENEGRRLHKVANGHGTIGIDSEIVPKIESLSFSHERLQQQVEEVQNDLRRLPREVNDLESRIEKLDRSSANKNASKNVQNQIDKTQTGIRKLAESVQVVKNVLMDRIKEEETNRQRQTNILKNELVKLRSRIQGS